jgi:PAS domain S-box-containing protein
MPRDAHPPWEELIKELYDRLTRVETDVEQLRNASVTSTRPRVDQKTDVIDESAFDSLPPWADEFEEFVVAPETTRVDQMKHSTPTVNPPRERALPTLEPTATTDTLARTAIEMLSEAVVGVDKHGNVQLWNDVAAGFFGWNADEITGGPVLYVPQDRLQDHSDLLRYDSDIEGQTEKDFECRHKNGMPLRVKMRLQRSPCGGTVIFYRQAPVTTDPVSDPRAGVPTPPPVRHHQTVAPQDYPLVSLARATLGLTHDFNNTLTSLSGFAELIRDALPPGEHRELATSIVRTMEMYGHICRRILTIHRPESGTPPVADVHSILKQSERLWRAIGGTKVTMLLHIEPNLPMCQITPGELFQLVLNLTTNASDAMKPHGGCLTISATQTVILPSEPDWPRHLPTGGYLLLSISDTGPGLDPTILPRLFELGITSRPDTNHGIGMSIIREILNRSLGHIRPETSPRGTTFHVYLRQA